MVSKRQETRERGHAEKDREQRGGREGKDKFFSLVKKNSGVVLI